MKTDALMTTQSLTEQVKQIGLNINGLTTTINYDLHELTAAKRSKVTKFESVKRHLKDSAEQFHLYLSDVKCLFEYLGDKDLEKILTETRETAIFDQLLKSVDRAKTSHDNFKIICKHAEEKCRKRAEQCESYSLATAMKKSKRLKSGRTLVVNQLMFAIGGIVSVIALMSVLITGTSTYDATIASSLTVALLVTGVTTTAAIVTIAILVYDKQQYDKIGNQFLQLENGFKGLNDQMVNLRQLLLHVLHAQVLIVEKILINSKEILINPINEGTMKILMINIDIITSRGQTYRAVSTDLHIKFNEVFTFNYLKMDNVKNKQIPSSTDALILEEQHSCLEEVPTKRMEHELHLLIEETSDSDNN